MKPFEDGLDDVDGVDVDGVDVDGADADRADGDAYQSGEVLAVVAGVPVRTSANAGSYYCAHAWWTITGWASDAQTSAVLDEHGEPLVGFLHVPADEQTTGGAAPRSIDRHAVLREVVANALSGWLELMPSGGRVLLTGFAQFAGVVDNPTGAFVGDLDEVARALACATGVDVRIDVSANAVRGRGVEVVSAVLPVDDRAIDHGRSGSLPDLLHRVRPHAVLALGVHRGTDHFRVEVRPTSAGLVLDDGGARHSFEPRAALRRGDVRSLARAIARGASRRSLARG